AAWMRVERSRPAAPARSSRVSCCNSFRARVQEENSPMPEIVVALTTVPAAFDAAALARVLVEARVAACVTVLPEMHSTYQWQGAVTVDREQQLVIKTARGKLAELWTLLQANH